MKHIGLRGNKNASQISDSVRGAESTELSRVRVNNEVAFCKVYNLKMKEEVEKILLKHRISYYGRNRNFSSGCLIQRQKRKLYLLSAYMIRPSNRQRNWWPICRM